MRRASIVASLSLVLLVFTPANPTALTGDAAAAVLPAPASPIETSACSLVNGGTTPPLFDTGPMARFGGGCPPGFCDDEYEFCVSGCNANDLLCVIGCMWQYNSCEQHCSTL